MKEIDDIIKAYDEASAHQQKTALATVVHVEGSSYRRPGARMLVTETGALTGAISGGCLEGDALRKAMLAIHEGRNKLVTYDTTNEDDARFGVQLGCNGTIHILFEPIHEAASYNPIALLRKAATARNCSVLVTLFSLVHHHLQPGTSYFLNDQGAALSEGDEYRSLPADLTGDAQDAWQKQTSQVKQYGPDLTAFIEVIEPKLNLVIFGAGNDVFPILKIAGILGWGTTIADGRYTHANPQRFPDADRIIVAKADTVLSEIPLDSRTALLLMTHNYNYDLEVLRQLTARDCAYVGILGPKKKFIRMTDDLDTTGDKIPPALQQNLYSPVGLDIGAETAEEIALSITAEIKAAFSFANGRFLRDKEAPIHAKFQKDQV